MAAYTRPVPSLDTLPSRETFQSEYVRRHRPVVLKGAGPALLPQAWRLFHDGEGMEVEGDGKGRGKGKGGRWMARLLEILKDASTHM